MDKKKNVISSRLIEIFEDGGLVERIKSRLPYLFQIAELESSGKLTQIVLNYNLTGNFP